MIGRGRNLAVEREVLRLEVRSEQALRLDRYIIENLPWRSRSRVQALIRSGHIRVNGHVAKPSQRMRYGDLIELHLSSGTGVPDYEERELPALYEDEWILVLDKPAGLLVHPVGRHVYDTLINYLHHRYHGRRSEEGEDIVPRLCHRLDRDTTGVLVVAKDAWVHRDVSFQFESRAVDKRYLAIVEGLFPADHARLDRPLGEGRDLQEALAAGRLRPALTEVELLERGENVSLLSCVPRTGRQNQIRVHLAAAGFPILGDTRYGAAPGRAPRYYLHSERVAFWHPRLKARLEVHAPAPTEFREVSRATDSE